jgi:hypothetical protein
MTVRFLRAVLAGCVFVLTLSVPSTAFADVCDDAWADFYKAREIAANAVNAMEAAQDKADSAPSGPAGNAARDAAKRATDAWFEAQNDVLRKRNVIDQNNCQDRKVEWNTGRVFPYGFAQTEITFLEAWARFFSWAYDNNTSAFGAPQQPAPQAAPGSLLSRLPLSVVGRIEFTRAFGATTPAFLGGVRSTIPLNAHPEFRPFGEVLFGIERCGPCETNDFAIEFGAGTSYRRPQWDRVGIVAKLTFRTLPGVEFAGVQKRVLGGISYRLAPR